MFLKKSINILEMINVEKYLNIWNTKTWHHDDQIYINNWIQTLGKLNDKYPIKR